MNFNPHSITRGCPNWNSPEPTPIRSDRFGSVEEAPLIELAAAGPLAASPNKPLSAFPGESKFAKLKML